MYDDVPRSNSGGVLERNGNVNCTSTTTSPVSYIYWPTDRLPAGTYEVEVWYQADCSDTTPVTFNLRSGSTTCQRPPDAQPIKGQIYLTSFTVNVNGMASAGQGGFVGDSAMLDVGAALAGAIPLNYGDTVSGSITQNAKYSLYTFEGQAGDLVRIGMQATAGTRTRACSASPRPGRSLRRTMTRCSTRRRFAESTRSPLPADGTYIVIASH